MTIFATCTRNQDNSPHFLRLEITEESIPIFHQLINRALNCWDSAPKEIKDLGDMLTHGRVTQDHTYQAMNTRDTSRDFYNFEERALIADWISKNSQDKFLELVASNEVYKILKGEI